MIQVAVLWEGMLLQQDSPANLYCRPRTPELAGFLGESILLPGIAGPQTVECELGRLSLSHVHQPGAVDVLIRPEQISLGAPSSSQPQARIIGMEYFGHDATLHLELLHSQRTIKARTTGWHGYVYGQTVSVSVDGPVTLFRPERVRNSV